MALTLSLIGIYVLIGFVYAGNNLMVDLAWPQKLYDEYK